MAGSDLNAAGKKLLKGHLRHVEFHNKRQEEDEMWKQRQRELLSEESERSSEEAHLKLKSRIKRKRNVEHGSSAGRRDEVSYVNVYQRQLLKLEESDPTRWGHSGYKELHPEDFISTSSENEELEDLPKKVKQKKRKLDHCKVSKKKHKKSKKKHKEKRSKSKSKGSTNL